ncbi:hypothetical protein ACJMK2_044103 [Sinanodonta woodiana]|uniref:Mitochondrial import inner membrane translocase subunit TIM44 n=1 Tax=Sinanodonta woodiana TaxID=1069815 RepID=A0ABD3W259_SINWO
MAMWYRSLSKLSGQLPRNKILLGQSTCIKSNYSSMPSRQSESPILHHNFQFGGQLVQCRQMSSGERNFFKQFIDNLKTEWAKNKEMKESLKKFREERDKLEKSESLQKVREKFDRITAEGTETSTVVKKKLEEIGKKVSETLDEAQKSDIAKKGREFTEELSKSAGRVTETLYKQGESIGKSASFKTFSEGVRAVKEEIDESTMSRGKLYKAPAKLRKRTEKKMSMDASERTIEANEQETSVELHKDSKWYQSWQNFKENNEYVNKFFNLKMKYDESDNVAIRATRAFTDKMSYLFGGMFSKTEMSEVLTEICKIDPNFDNQKFIMMCEQEIIPNVLEAIVRGDLEVLKDWCYEAPYNTLAHPINTARSAGYIIDNKVLDINHVDIAAGKMMEQGPVLVISFSAQQIMVVRNVKGDVVEGDPEKIMKVMYVWALCRDQEELDPSAAWKLLDISASTGEQWL